MSRFVRLLLPILALCSFEVVAAEYESLGVSKVSKIQDYQLDGWQQVDDRSLIIQGGVSTRYLVVFKNRCRELKFAHSIAAPTKGGAIHAGFDSIRVVNKDRNPIPCMIKEIYKFKGDRAQANSLRDNVRALHKEKYKR